MKADASSLDYFSDGVNNTAAIMGQINNVSNIRTYANTELICSMLFGELLNLNQAADRLMPTETYPIL
jgi:hypothetical protein